jgi:dolichol kinase
MNLQIESYRKFLHFLLVIIPIAYLTLGKNITISILVAICLVVVPLDYMRRKSLAIKELFNRAFGLILREHEKTGERLSGASSVFLSALITFSFFKPEIAVTGFLILVFSDGLAALVGKAYPSQPFYEKSASGSLAFFVSALVVLIICGISFGSNFSFYFFGIFGVICVTIIEARPSLIKIDDNFTIPLVFAIEVSFFDIIWNYQY